MISKTCHTPGETFALGRKIGYGLLGGDVVLLYGGLGAGKTLLAKGILDALGFEVDEVTSPSFSLVNLYKTSPFNVYHIDLWRLEPKSDPAAAVGLEDILEDASAVTIIEWADRLSKNTMPANVIVVNITGDGDEPRAISISDSRDGRARAGEKI
ncbi:MAG: tRNA (adenosine(37)-N6)-threonylcarbamoyltransferase complex ATPase subunit type 1 TsaE [Pyrinomonadaceae bacterium]